MDNRIYIAIDLKSFYASVECVERGLDPLTTNLVVADGSRTEKTICLAVSPSLKAYGLGGRCRLFEAVQAVKKINNERRKKIPTYEFSGSSFDDNELKKDLTLSVNYIVAPPRMAHYMDYSTKIYQIYLKYIAAEDIHVYSIDEVFMDVTSYLQAYKMDAKQLAMTIIQDVLKQTGITATAGIGTNMYLCKVAMDIVAKHIPADKDGVRIAYLDEMSYRKQLWNHRPLTDFWRVGKGTQRRLNEVGIHTMGDIARCSIGNEKAYYNEDLLYKMFGVNAELLIDHAWGYEPTLIKDIKAYKPSANSLSSGQVLHKPYTFEAANIVVKEMVDELVLSLVEKELFTKAIVLTIGYEAEDEDSDYEGETTTDFYGREIPKHAHGIANLNEYTNSLKLISEQVNKLYIRIVNKKLLIRRITLAALDVKKESEITYEFNYDQLNLFSNPSETKETTPKDPEALIKEKNVQKAILSIKKSYGKNAVVKGMDLQEEATAIDRNKQIGGHKA